MQSLLGGSKIRRLHKLDAARMDCFSLFMVILLRTEYQRRGLSDSGSITGFFYLQMVHLAMCHLCQAMSLLLPLK